MSRIGGWLALGSWLLASACGAAGPRSIVIGSDECAYCRMSIAEPAFAAELVTRKGKIYTFDSVECLAGYALHAIASTEVDGLYVTDFARPGDLIPVEAAEFRTSRTLQSPMGLALVAFRRGGVPAGAAEVVGSERLSWQDVLSLVATRAPAEAPQAMSIGKARR